MKQYCLLFVSILLLTSIQVHGQTKHLIARTNVYIDSDNGGAKTGDSTVLAYNSLDQIIQFKSWNLYNNSNWVLEYRITDRSFDAAGRILSETGQLGNDVNGWTNSERLTYTYDSYGNRLTNALETWNGSMWVFNNIITTAWTYNAKGQVLSKTGATAKTIYTYNAQDSLETTTRQNWIGSNWENNEQIVYAYSPNGSQITSKTTYSWMSNAWVESYRSVYSYEVDGDLGQELKESWDGSNWANGSRVINTYDNNHNLVYWLWQNWSAGDWTPSFQQFNTFDAESNWLTTQFEAWDGSAWSVISVGHNYYGNIVSTNVPMAADFQVYPNPANATIRLEGAALTRAQVFDLNGREVLHQCLGGHKEESLEVGQLPAGTYFLQVSAQDGSAGVKSLYIRR